MTAARRTGTAAAVAIGAAALIWLAVDGSRAERPRTAAAVDGGGREAADAAASERASRSSPAPPDAPSADADAQPPPRTAAFSDLRVIVLDPDGDSVAGASVTVEPSVAPGARPDWLAFETRSDARGICSFTSLPANACLRARTATSRAGSGDAAAIREAMESAANEPLDSGYWVAGELRALPGDPKPLVLRRTAAIQGLVLEADDTPVPGVAVTFASLESHLAGRAPVPAATVTDELGRFATSILPGAELIAQATSQPRTVRARLRAESPSTLQVILRFDGRCGVDGVVVDDAGAPLAGVAVTLLDGTADERAGGGEPRTCRSAADGTFGFDLPGPGTWVPIVACGSDTPPWRFPAVRVADAARPRLRLSLQRAAPIRGRVITPAGTAVAGAKVEAFAAYPRSPAIPENAVSCAPATTATAADGSFEVADTRDGARYDLLATAGPARTGAIDVAPGAEVILVVDGARPSATLRLRIADGDRPVAAIRYRVFREDAADVLHGNVELRAASSADGTYAIDSLVAGLRYSIELAADGLAPTFLRHVVAGADTERRVELSRLSGLTCFVADGSGLPVGYASIVLSAEGRVVQAGRTGPDGTVTFRSLPQGTYSVEIAKAAATHVEPSVIVGAETRELQFQLGSGRTSGRER